MPVARYFLFVGGILLALLFAVDAYAPLQVVAAGAVVPSVDKSIVRIHTDQKWPERLVYDTSLPTVVPPPVTIVAALPPAPVANATAQARVRDTLAQYIPAEPRKVDPQVQRKPKIVRVRSNPPVRLAQQSHFGFFGNGTW